jgi:hypothetical protein
VISEHSFPTATSFLRRKRGERYLGFDNEPLQDGFFGLSRRLACIMSISFGCQGSTGSVDQDIVTRVMTVDPMRPNKYKSRSILISLLEFIKSVCTFLRSCVTPFQIRKPTAVAHHGRERSPRERHWHHQPCQQLHPRI